MKKLLLILVLALGIGLSGQSCISISNKVLAEAEQYRIIELEMDEGYILSILIPADMSNFFVQPYEFEMFAPITNKYAAVAFRNKNIFDDVYVIGMVREGDDLIVVNILKGIDDTYYIYMYFGPGEKGNRPHQVTREEFFKNIEHWTDKTKELGDIWYWGEK